LFRKYCFYATLVLQYLFNGKLLVVYLFLFGHILLEGDHRTKKERSELMELFTIVVMNPSKPSVNSLSDSIRGELRHLHKDQETLQLSCEWHDKFAYIHAQSSLTETERKKIARKMMESLGIVVANHVMKELEPEILRDLIKKEVKADSAEELQQVEGYCNQFLNGEGETAASSLEAGERRRSLIAGQVTAYFQENLELNLEGFLRFRLHDYMEELREVVIYAIDEYTMDKQYQEFISLLKYFVYIQEAKIPVAHLIHKGGHEFVILNDMLEPIDMNEFDSTFKLEVLEKDINFEDMIVSTLITVSPAQIYIHTREPDMPVIHTITQIFEDRTRTCSYCRMCHSYLGEANKQDQLYP
jgi:putative sporulation protein YtxC